MAIDIDGFVVLGAIARRPDCFPAVKAEVAKTAKGFVVKQLKDKALTLEQLKAIGEAVDLDAFDLIVDGMSDAEIKAVLAKVDKLNDEAKGAAPQAQRKQISDLVRGRIVPAARAEKPKLEKPAKAVKPKVERSGNSKAMAARKRV